MRIYHFINYRKEKLADYIDKINDCGGVICLDLEDSIQDIFNPQNTSELKNCHRKLIKQKLNSQSDLQNIKFGLRINPVNTFENALDINLLGKICDYIKIESIFITKVERKDDITEFEKCLDKWKIKYNEIVAVIETQKGFRNLREIISASSDKLKKIAFGHCDYNLDAGMFPFHHQNSDAYWDCVKYIVSITESVKEVEFINSPFLELDNLKGFEKMLSKLNSICQNNFGQITLTHKQSKICSTFLKQRIEMNSGFQNSIIDTIDTEEYAKNIVTDFKKFNIQNGFSVAGNNRILISPHEFKAALKYLNPEKK